MFLLPVERFFVGLFSLRPRDHRPFPLEAAKTVVDQKFYARQSGATRLKNPTKVINEYRHHGFRKGYSPHPLFDETWYQARNPDVRKAELPGLFHYLEYGFREGRSPHPLFNESRYRLKNADVAGAAIPGLLHYLEYGFREGRSPHALFDEVWYRETVGIADDVPGLTHFVTVGYSQGRSPHPLITKDFLEFELSQR